MWQRRALQCLKWEGLHPVLSPLLPCKWALVNYLLSSKMVAKYPSSGSLTSDICHTKDGHTSSESVGRVILLHGLVLQVKSSPSSIISNSILWAIQTGSVATSYSTVSKWRNDISFHGVGYVLSQTIVIVRLYTQKWLLNTSQLR